MISKTTEDLISEIKTTTGIELFLDSNKDEFFDVEIKNHLVKLLKGKGLKKSKVIEKSGLDSIYAYQIFSGLKNPSRDKVLQLAFGFKLSLDETSKLLKMSNVGELYPRNRRDSIIIFCINKGMSFQDSNELLYDLDEFIF